MYIQNYERQSRLPRPSIDVMKNNRITCQEHVEEKSEHVEEKSEHIEVKSEHIEQKSEHIELKSEHMKQKLKSLEEKLKSLEEKLKNTAQEKLKDNVEEKMKHNVDEKLKHVDEKLKTVENSVEEKMKHVDEKLKHVEDSVEEKMKHVDEKLKHVENSVDQKISVSKASIKYVESVVPSKDIIKFSPFVLEAGQHVTECQVTCMNSSSQQDCGIMLGMYDVTDGNENLIATGSASWFGKTIGNDIYSSYQSVILKGLIHLDKKQTMNIVLKIIGNRYSSLVLHDKKFPCIFTII
jgi:DNA polymerase III alpha subunit (gram-positive type)